MNKLKKLLFKICKLGRVILDLRFPSLGLLVVLYALEGHDNVNRIWLFRIPLPLKQFFEPLQFLTFCLNLSFCSIDSLDSLFHGKHYHFLSLLLKFFYGAWKDFESFIEMHPFLLVFVDSLIEKLLMVLVFELVLERFDFLREGFSELLGHSSIALVVNFVWGAAICTGKLVMSKTEAICTLMYAMTCHQTQS